MAEVVYKVDIDSSSIQSKLMQVRMSLEQAVKGAVSGYVGSVGQGLGDPMSSGLGGGMAAFQGGMAQQMQRMTVGQQYALGGSQIGMATGEYGHADFYKQLLLGAAPGSSHAALQARMAIGGMAAQMPIGSAFGGTQAELSSFMGQVGTSHANEAGFSAPFLQALQSANFRNMGTPFRLSGAIEALQNSMWTGRAFGLSGEAIAGDFNNFAAMGMNPGQMQDTFKSLQLGRMAGTPEEVLQAQMGRSMQNQMMAQRMGGYNPIGSGQALGMARNVSNMVTAMRDVDPELIATPFDLSRLTQAWQSMSVANGGRDPSEQQKQTALRMVFGQRAAGMDLGAVSRAANMSGDEQDYQLGRSENIARNQAAITEAFSVRGLMRGVIGSTLGQLPGGLGRFFQDSISPTPEDPGGIPGLGGRVVGLGDALRGVNMGATIEKNGVSVGDVAAAGEYASNQRLWDTVKRGSLQQRRDALAVLLGKPASAEQLETLKKKGPLSLETMMSFMEAAGPNGALERLLGDDATGKAITSRVNAYQSSAESQFDATMRGAGIATKFKSDAERLNLARAIQVETTRGTPEYERNRDRFLKSGVGTQETLDAAAVGVTADPALAARMNNSYQNLALIHVTKAALSDQDHFQDRVISGLKGGTPEEQAQAKKWSDRRAANLKTPGKSDDTDLTKEMIRSGLDGVRETMASFASNTGSAADKRNIEKVGSNLIKSLGDFIAVVKDISAPQRPR